MASLSLPLLSCLGFTFHWYTRRAHASGPCACFYLCRESPSPTPSSSFKALSFWTPLTTFSPHQWVAPLCSPGISWTSLLDQAGHRAVCHADGIQLILTRPGPGAVWGTCGPLGAHWILLGQFGVPCLPFPHASHWCLVLLSLAERPPTFSGTLVTLGAVEKSKRLFQKPEIYTGNIFIFS